MLPIRKYSCGTPINSILTYAADSSDLMPYTLPLATENEHDILPVASITYLI